MAIKTKVEVQGADPPSEDVVVSVIRCVEGEMTVGEVFNVATLAGGGESEVSLRVTRIWRYGRLVDLVDPPHSARVELMGCGVGSVSGFSHLIASREE